MDSTNRVAAAWARQGGPNGAVVRADRQSAGRGREGRAWHSPHGGLWFSMILRPPRLTGLSLIAGLAVVRAVEELGLPARVRWPNDVYLGDRKLAGILCEARLRGAQVDYAILGIGLNVDLLADDFPPALADHGTSLRLALGHSPGLEAVFERLLDHLDALYDRYLREGFSVTLRAEVEAACSTLGRRVHLLLEAGAREGRAVSLSEEGELVLEDGARIHSVRKLTELGGERPRPG